MREHEDRPSYPTSFFNSRLVEGIGKSDKREAEVKAGIRRMCSTIGNVNESITYVQCPLRCQNPCGFGPAPDNNVELPRLFRHLATEICPYRTSATFDLGMQPIEADESILQFRRDPDSLAGQWFVCLESQQLGAEGNLASIQVRADGVGDRHEPGWHCRCAKELGGLAGQQTDGKEGANGESHRLRVLGRMGDRFTGASYERRQAATRCQQTGSHDQESAVSDIHDVEWALARAIILQ